MIDIKLQNDLRLKIDIIEYDEVLPSIKINIDIKTQSLKGGFDINFNFWSRCEDFDRFIAEDLEFIKDLIDNKRICFTNDSLVVAPIFSNPNIKFDCVVEIKIDEESKGILRNKFLDFDRWW